MSSFIWLLFLFFCMWHDIFAIDFGVKEICKYANKLFWLKPNSKFVFLLCVKSQSYTIPLHWRPKDSSCVLNTFCVSFAQDLFKRRQKCLILQMFVVDLQLSLSVVWVSVRKLSQSQGSFFFVVLASHPWWHVYVIIYHHHHVNDIMTTKLRQCNSLFVVLASYAWWLVYVISSSSSYKFIIYPR